MGFHTQAWGRGWEKKNKAHLKLFSADDSTFSSFPWLPEPWPGMEIPPRPAAIVRIQSTRSCSVARVAGGVIL